MSYTTGLCDCMKDTSSCVDIYCCFPCQVGRQCAASNASEPQVDTFQCTGCLFALFFPALGACCIRRNVAERFNLDEGCCGSTCFACLCPSCSLCQTHRELTIRGTWPGGVCCHKEPGTFDNAPIQ
jgi:Cys-rich protein (TIGR01571 family)